MSFHQNQKVHIDIDPSTINKIIKVDALKEMLKMFLRGQKKL